MFNFVHKNKHRDDGPYKIGLDCTDRGRFVPHTDASIFRLHDMLDEAVQTNIANGKPPLDGHVKELQTNFGLNYNPAGLIGNRALRQIIRPVSNYFRVIQHTLASSGVARTLVACTLTVSQKDPVLKDRGLALKR